MRHCGAVCHKKVKCNQVISVQVTFKKAVFDKNCKYSKDHGSMHIFNIKVSWHT